MLVQQPDEWREQRAVESVLVKLVRLDVRGRDHHDSRLEQPREQPPENHRIRDVGDVKLVEAEEPGFLGERGGCMRDRVAVRDLAGLDLLAIEMHALVHVGHELMKVRAAFARHRTRGKEQIHQHGLAAPDVAMNVEALDRAFLLSAFSEQPAEMRGLAREPMLRKALLEPRQPRRDRLLRGIALGLAFADKGGVAFGDG